MRVPSPSSRGAFTVRLSVFDVVWAFASPLLALYFRDAYVLSYEGTWTVASYCLLSAAFSLAAFVAFRVRDGLADCFSVHDALAVAKAVIFADLMTCVVLFNLTRLEGIPRATPIIHALILATGLITARTFARVLEKDRSNTRQGHIDAEHIVVIGSNRLSSLYIKMLEAYASNRHRIIAVLDERPRMFGRSIEGVRVVGHPQELTSIIDEFAVHGIRTDRVIIGGEADLLSEEALEEVQRVCNQREIRLDFVPGLIGLSGFQAAVAESRTETPSEDETESLASSFVPPASFTPPTYFRVRRLIDFFAALMLIVLLMPLFIGVSVLVLLDVGSPAFFWQQRIGLCRRTFLLYKFRTLQPPFDWHGRRSAGSRRSSIVADWAAVARYLSRRTAPIVECAGRRHVADWPASPSSGRSTFKSDRATHGASRHYRLGSSKRRQAAETGG
jgi:hypothetical protein